MPQVMNEALDEIERRAWLESDLELLEVIHRAEEYAEDYVSPEHEEVINDRNQLRDALTTCVEEMEALIALSEALGEGEVLKISEDFEAAAVAGDTSVRNSLEVPQYDDTIADKLAKAEAESERLQVLYDQLHARVQSLRELQHICEQLVNKASSTYRPKWVMTLAHQLARVRASAK